MSTQLYKDTLDSGNFGQVMWKNKPILGIKKFEGKKVFKYEELPNPFVPGGTIRKEVGFTIPISMEFIPTGVEDLTTDMLFGNDLIVNNVGVNGKVFSRKKYVGITWDEDVLDSFEKNKMTSISASGQAENVIDL